MAAPVAQLRKDQIVRLSKLKCKHSHSYLDHWACWLEDHPEGEKERIGYFDIEASGLKADYGMMLSWAIKDGNSNDCYYDVLTKKDIDSGHEDRRIVESCVDTLKQFTKIVTFYGTNFDFPFLRSRALITGVEFPSYGEIFHKDAYFIAKSKINLSSRRLENCCRQLLGKTEKTRIETTHWRGAMRGVPAALDYIVDHNCKDCTDLEKLYNVLAPFTKPSRTSI